MIIDVLLLISQVCQTSQQFLTAQQYEWVWRMHPIWFGGWGIAMMIGMMVFWAIIIGACIVGLRRLLTDSKLSPQDRAMTILRERFARGEIDNDEFEARKQQLL